MKINGREAFEVRMLGGFAIIYDGRELILGRKSSLKFIQLLQIVWLKSNLGGVSKEQLSKALYGEKEVSNVNNSVNNLLYQLRGQMEKAGMPKGEYVCFRDRKYVVDEMFPVKLDVLDFSEELGAAGQASDEGEKFKHYRAAFDLYRGELLPASSTENWVITAGMNLKKNFEKAADWLESYYKKERNFSELEFLYERMVKLYPYDHWQIRQIELLIEKKEYKQAIDLYDRTVREYSEEFGTAATPELASCYQKISELIYHDPGEMDAVVWNMIESAGQESEQNGAYYCSYRSFVDISHMVSRSIERTGTSMNLTLCTIVDYEGKMIQNKEKLEEYSGIVRGVLRTSLRKSDVVTRYSNSQYLILLVGTGREHCELIYQRINQRLRTVCNNRVRLRYLDASLDQLRSASEM